MRTTAIRVAIALVSLLIAPLAAAQNGAEIIRDEQNWAGYEWDEGDVLAVLATDEYFFCGDEENLVPYDFMAVLRPDGSAKVRETGFLFVRVYQPATPDDFWGPDGDPCPFIEAGPMVAEGIVHFAWADNDAFVNSHSARNTFGYTVSGTLYDLVGACGSGMVDLTIIRRFQIDKKCDGPDCFIFRRLKGPDLECVE